MASVSTQLRRHGLKDTRTRRRVIRALKTMEKPVSAYDIQHWLAAQGEGINQVTVYRVLSALEKSALVHRHPCDRSYSLCTIPEVKGHHGFLHCSTCGRTQEFSNDGLSEAVRKVARSQKFQPLQHMSELVGTCVLCAS